MQISKPSPENSYKKEVLSSFKKRIILTNIYYKRLSIVLGVVGYEINYKYRVNFNRNGKKKAD